MRIARLRRLLCAICNVLLLSVLATGLIGCSDSRQPTSESPETAAQRSDALRAAGLLEGTVGTLCTIEGMRGMQVEAIGLVVGLPGTGNTFCPDNVLKNLIQDIRKLPAVTDWVESTGRSVREYIVSSDTAVVRVRGIIPPGMPDNHQFDVQVEALEGTQTTSLMGGFLLRCEMRVYQDASLDEATSTRELARASGQIFINPFGQPDAEQQTRGRFERTGIILGGATTLESRRVWLLLHSPSYAMARQIEARINQRFPRTIDGPVLTTAEAQTASRIYLNLPHEYREEPYVFLKLIQNILVRNSPSEVSRRLDEFITQMTEPSAPADSIAFALEAIGRTVLPQLQTLYTSSNRRAAYYSARTGLRLNDPLAIPVLQRFIREQDDQYASLSIYELGRAVKLRSATLALREVLDYDNVELRVDAYEALRHHNDSTVMTIPLGHSNFELDLVRSKAGPLVYVRTEGKPVVALFGRNLHCRPPLFYAHTNAGVTITADTGDTDLRIIRRYPNGTVSDPVSASLKLSELIILMGRRPRTSGDGTPTGLGLDYSHVVGAIHALCNADAINAEFRLQSEQSRWLTWSDPARGRPESIAEEEAAL